MPSNLSIPHLEVHLPGYITINSTFLGCYCFPTTPNILKQPEFHAILGSTFELITLCSKWVTFFATLPHFHSMICREIK